MRFEFKNNEQQRQQQQQKVKGTTNTLKSTLDPSNWSNEWLKKVRGDILSQRICKIEVSYAVHVLNLLDFFRNAPTVYVLGNVSRDQN